MKKKDNEKKRKIDLIVKVFLVIIIILLLIHSCVLKGEKDKYQNALNGNVDIIDIKCDDNRCKPIATPTINPIIPTPVVPKAITSLSFAQKNISVLKGSRIGLVVNIKPIELSSTKLTWTSSDESIVTIDTKGMIKALNEGTVTITVTSPNGKKATITVTVTKEPINVEKITLSADSKVIKAGASTQVTATISPENATTRELVWSSSNEKIATVDSKGIVTGIKAGAVTITVKTKDGKVKGTITITVEPTATPTPQPTPMQITSLAFAQENASVQKGKTLGLVVEVKPVELADSKLTWTSSDPSIVSVDSNGIVKGLKEGTATITVTSSNGKKATITVTVTTDEVPVQKITLSTDNKTINVGKTTQISAVITPDNATDQELVWSSSDTSIATVDSKGIVKGIKAGTVTITAKTKDGKVKETITITVQNDPTPTQITSVTILQDNVSIQIGDTLALPFEIKPSELASSSLTWTSSDPTIASVDENGVVTALKEGTVTITAISSNGKTDTCTVNVTTDVIDVQEIELSTNNIKINAGMTTQIGATVKPTTATNKDLVWTSSDESIVTVDSNGWINALVEGTVTITVRTVDGTVEATCTVVVDNDDGSDTVKVYDRDKTPVTWNGADDLKIFTKSIYNMDGVIAPESENTYKFIVKNSTEYNIKYSIKFVESNDYDINMKYKLKRNDTYVVDHYVSYDELDITNQILNTNTTDTYYLEWKWISSSNDTSIGQNPSASYGLQIEVEAESING